MKKCNCMCKFTDDVRSNSTSVWLFAVCAFLLGLVFGFFISPVKNGMTIGCNNNDFGSSSAIQPKKLECKDDVK